MLITPFHITVIHLIFSMLMVLIFLIMIAEKVRE